MRTDDSLPQNREKHGSGFGRTGTSLRSQPPSQSGWIPKEKRIGGRPASELASSGRASSPLAPPARTVRAGTQGTDVAVEVRGCGRTGSCGRTRPRLSKEPEREVTDSYVSLPGQLGKGGIRRDLRCP